MSGEEFLESVRNSSGARKLLEYNAQKIRARLYNVSAPPLDRERVGGGNYPAGLESKLDKLDEIERKMLDAEAESRRALKTAYCLINKLVDPTTAQVMWAYYGGGEPAAKIAGILGTDESTVRRMKRNGLSEFEGIYQEFLAKCTGKPPISLKVT